MKKNKIRLVSGLLLTAVLVLSTVVMKEAFAADPVQDIACSMQVNCASQYDMTGTVNTTSFGEIKTRPVTINLYKVADISVSGKYTGVGAFAGMDFSTVNDETTTAQWIAMADEAKKIVSDAAAAKTPVALTKTQDTENGTTTFTELGIGMYLVDAQETLSETYRYNFQPYLVSLPNNYFYSSGNDTWVYDLTEEHAVGLKPEREDLFGDLVIRKTVDVFNGTFKDATFVFQVEATKADPDALPGTDPEPVFSDVFAINFTGPDTKTLTVGPIPAGANVVVTEVYTGASYTVDSETKTATIVAKEVLAKDSEKQVATVDFTNTHNNGYNGGNGLVNSFKYDSKNKSWGHSAAADSTN